MLALATLLLVLGTTPQVDVKGRWEGTVSGPRPDGTTSEDGIGAATSGALVRQRLPCWPLLARICVTGADGSMRVTVWSAVMARTVGGTIWAGT